MSNYYNTDLHTNPYQTHLEDMGLSKESARAYAKDETWAYFRDDGTQSLATYYTRQQAIEAGLAECGAGHFAVKRLKGGIRL